MRDRLMEDQILQPSGSSIAWVARSVGRDLTCVEQELVTIVCAALRTGPWNIHPDWSIMRGDGGGGASMHIKQHLSTFDADYLTRLVFAAHDRCCRVEVHPSGPRGLRVTVHLRAARSEELHRRHPTLEHAVTAWRDCFTPRPGDL